MQKLDEKDTYTPVSAVPACGSVAGQLNSPKRVGAVPALSNGVSLRGKMKKVKIVSVLIALLLAAIISGCIVHEEVSPDEKTGKKVLLIFSYHAEYPWVIEETRGAEDILRDKGVETENFYLDTKRRTSAEWKKKVSEDAVKKIEEFKPDLVIVFDDNACELVAMKYAGKSLPFVFCGMNGDPEDYGFPAENIAGVVERQHINGTIDLLKQLVPDVKKVAIITDNSPTSHGFVTRIEKTALPVEISECYTTDDFDAWKAKVKELQSEVDAIGLFVYHTIEDPEKEGEASLPPEDVLSWTIRNSKLPEFAFLDFTVRAGALCGVTLSGYEQGKAAAEIAIEILDGKKPADIPIKCPEKGNPIINERRAEELDITVPMDIVKEVVVIDNEDKEKEVKEEQKELKVAVLHTSPIEDYGWTYEAHLGAQAMAEALPYVELSEGEDACGPDAPQIMREYAEAGYEVIFCHSYNFGEYIEEVAPDYPNVIFMWGAGVEKKAPNAGIYFGRMYESRFLTGIVAGSLTETNKIGYAAAFPTSEVVRGIDAFAKGVASVNPDAKVYVEWIGEWYNPPKEKEATLFLIDRGCDVITHHSDSYAPGEAAEERGVNYISFGSDMRRFAPHVFLTGTVWNWTPIMTNIVKAVHEGTWDERPDQDWWYGLAEGGVKLAPFSDLVPDEVRVLVEEKRQTIIKGEFEVFPRMTDDELREIYYFEPNVVGELPVKEAEEAIKIGAIYPLTGSLATTGADVKNGVLFAVDIINNEHKMDIPLARSKGIDSLDGAKIKIVFGDSQGSPSAGKYEAERLTDKEKVVALIGCYQSAVTAEASQVAEDKGIPFLTALSSAPSLTQRGFNWLFRTTPDDKTFVQGFYEFLQDVQEEKGVKVEKLGIVCENSVWGSEFSADIRQYAEGYGYQVVEDISYASDTKNVSNEVQRLKNANPDVVMQASYTNDAILYMQTYKETKFTPDAILADDAGFIEPEFLKTLGDDGNYILTRATWSKDLAEAKPLVETVNQMFRERYGTDMTGNSARAFTGMLVLADAINRAGSTDPEKIRKALLETNISSNEIIVPWDGVRFDQETHQNTLGKGIICQIIDQEYYTVWPGDIATKELIWPMPM